MTSRLKHKLELDNVNLNSAYLNESFVQIGTPLPALADHKKDKLEYVPEWQQEVRDEQGRRRFHGAFTGGFSAGYYNSVGSKEGWAPSTFKSSRNNRANKAQRAEDFMDEEDLQSMRDDRKLENTDTFRSDRLGGTQDELAGRNLPSSLESLIAPAKSSIGEKLLQKLGWRPGQGIGPRVTLRKMKLQQGKLGKARAGIQDDDEDEAIDMDDPGAGKHTFAPRDVRLLVFDAKEDKQGLGFIRGSGMGSLPASRPIMGARDMDDDDHDPYAEAGPSRNHLAFDHGDDDDDIIVMGGSDRPGLGMGGARGVTKSLKRADRTGGDYGSSSDAQDRWHDGRTVLIGFALDPRGVPPDKWFAMPEIPQGWRPRPARVWGTTRKWDEQPNAKKEEKEVVRGAPGRPLTFEQRGAALGEEQRISQAKSIYEYMSEKDQQRLATLATTTSAKFVPPPALSLEEPAEEVSTLSSTEIEIPPLSPRTAAAALKGYIPYGDDLKKQDRYRSYLTSQTYNTKEPNPQLARGSIEEINKELQGFASSARIFKPLSFAMSNRFTAGSSSLAASDLKQAKPGLHMFDVEKAKAEAEKEKASKAANKMEVETALRKDLTPRETAAKSGMFGKMTRESRKFYPVKLLCKRFGVQDPHPEGDPGKPADPSAGRAGAGASGNGFLDVAPLPSNDASWESKFIHKPGSGPGESSTTGTSTSTLTGQVEGGAGAGAGAEAGEKKPTSLAEVGMAEDINQGRDTLTYTKPNIDIFKAIFASDDEDDDDDEDEDDASNKIAPSTKTSTKGGDGERKAQATGSTEEVGRLQRTEDPYPVKEEGPVDPSTFKPIFTLSSKARSKHDTGGEEEDATDKSKKKKDKGKSKKRKGVLSFDVGDDGDEDDARDEERKRDEKRKKREKEKERDVPKEKDRGTGVGDIMTNPNGRREETALEHGNDLGMEEWVEKPQIPPRLAGRKGAADFM